MHARIIRIFFFCIAIDLLPKSTVLKLFGWHLLLSYSDYFFLSLSYAQSFEAHIKKNLIKVRYDLQYERKEFIEVIT